MRLALLLTIVLFTSGLPGERLDVLTDSRKLLGIGRIHSVIIQFEFESSIQGIANVGHGRLLYAEPRRYRMDRTLLLPGRPPWLGVRSIDGERYASWGERNGRVTHYKTAEDRIPAARQSLLNDVMVPVVALLLADAEFLSYRPHADSGSNYHVRSVDGREAELTLADNMVREVRYLRPWLTAAVSSAAERVTSRRDEAQKGVARVSDFRMVANRRLPHRLVLEFEQGREQWNIKQYAINPNLGASEFSPPAGSAQ